MDALYRGFYGLCALYSKTADSGWISVPNLPYKYRKSNGWVQITGYHDVGTSGTAYKVLFTLPEGYRPTEYVWFPCITARFVVGVIQVDTNGGVSIRTNVNATNLIMSAVFLAG